MDNTTQTPSNNSGGLWGGIASILGTNTTTVTQQAPANPSATSGISTTAIVVLSVTMLVFGVIAYFVIFKKQKA